MSTQPIRIGTRGSQLAMWQASHIAGELRKHGHSVAVEVIRTTGDRMQDPDFLPPSAFEDGTPLDAKGIFIKEIEDALLDGRIDVAVHCLKDLPTSLDPRFTLAAIPDARRCARRPGMRKLLGTPHAPLRLPCGDHQSAPSSHAVRPAP